VSSDHPLGAWLVRVGCAAVIRSLPSWGDTEPTHAITDFVTASVTEGPGFVEPADRIATFDNDGTLWVEKPAPPQIDFIFRALAKAAQEDSSLAEKDPYKAILAQDPDFFGKIAEQQPEVLAALEEAIARTWEGTAPEDFEAEVASFFSTVKQEKFGVSYSELIYQPMLELFDYLKANEFRVFVCSGGGRDFMRAISEEAWGLFKENVIGTAAEYEYRDGALARGTTILGGLALGAGKPEHIFARTGRLPTFAGGNGDVDVEMLEAATFALTIKHDDEEREYAYTDGAEKVLAEAKERDWTVVSVKDDWKTVFKKGRKERSDSDRHSPGGT
jgi:phosphoserine phosphatase